MCEIFCFNSGTPKQINNCLECFYNHSEEHPHGWGLATFDSNNLNIKKEPVKAKCSPKLKEILSHPIIGKNIFAHIRLATVGELILPNCHPFIEKDANNRTWMLIHNGTIFESPELEKYKTKEKGSTDSERILLYVIDTINKFEKEKNALATIKERFNIISDLLTGLAKNNKLNIMIYDGDLTYIHTNMKEGLHYIKQDNEILIASTPVTEDENWREVEINKIYGVIDGNIIFESEKHDNEFIFTEYHEKLIMEFLESSNIEYDNLGGKQNGSNQHDKTKLR